MSLAKLIEQAIEKAGNQIRLAELLDVKQQDVSKWKTGKRYCTTPTRVELCKIADYDLKVALIEQVIEGLDPNDKVQADAGATLQAVVDAFPNAGWRRLYLTHSLSHGLRAVIRLSFLINQALDNRVRNTKTLSNTLQGV